MLYHIFRCKPSLTLQTAAALYAAGVRAYAPHVYRWRRLRHGPAKRVLDSSLPGFLFVPAPYAQLADSHGRNPAMRITRMVVNGQDATVRLLELHKIRGQDEPPPQDDHPTQQNDVYWNCGDAVEVTSGPFTGVRGVVEAKSRQNYTVNIPASGLRLTIAGCALGAASCKT